MGDRGEASLLSVPPPVATVLGSHSVSLPRPCKSHKHQLTKVYHALLGPLRARQCTPQKAS